MGDALVAPPEELHVFGETLQKKTTGAQLFDKDTVTLDSYINDENGNVLPDSTKTICASDYISVGDLSNISVSASGGNERMAFYDNGKSFVSGKNGYGLIQVPENAVYARFTVKKESLSTFMINAGTSAKSWEPYTGNKPSPSPEYPQKMLPAGSVMTTGAQLFDASRLSDVSMNGATLTNNGDGSFTVSGEGNLTGVFSSNYRISKDEMTLKPGKVSIDQNSVVASAIPYIFFQALDSSGSVVFNISNQNVYASSANITEEMISRIDRYLFGFFGASGATIVNYTIKPMIYQDGNGTWEPYTEGKPAVNPQAGQIGMSVYGGNLLDVYNLSYVGNCILQSDGSFKSNIVNAYFCEIRFSNVQWLKNGDTLHFRINDGIPDKRMSIVVYGEFENGSTTFEASNLNGENEVSLTLQGMISVLHIALRFNRIGIAFSDTETIISGLMFSVFDADSYEPYKQPQTIMFNTPGGLPGIPVSSDGNYTDADGQQWLSDSIEYKNEKLMYVQRVETLRLLKDVGSIDSQNGYLDINNFLNADITRRSGSLCTHLTYGDTRGDNVFWIDSSGTGVRIKISKYTTSEEYLSWLAENEVYLTYPCANPIEKEISDPNLINQLKSLRLNSPNTTIVNDANAFQKLKYLKETFTMANVNFRFGTYEQYKALGSKDTNTLYFVDGVIYKGDVPYSQKVEMVSAFPDTANAAQGILYVNSSTYEAKFFNGTDFTTVFVGTVGNMDDAGNDNKVVTQAAVKAYVTKQLADADIPTDGAIDEKINAAKEEAITEAVSQAGTAADQKDAALKTQLEQTMDTKIAAQVASVFRFKGSKANKGEIDAIEGMVTGDVWHSEDDGKEYVYDGEAWELLGFTVDLSAYATTAAVTQAINAKAEELTSAIATAKSEAIAAAKTETTTQVNAHAGDKTIHITGEERTAWNAKADTSYVDSAKQAAITAAASDATTKANQALTDAKAYTDQKNSAMDTRMKAVEAAVTWGEIA